MKRSAAAATALLVIICLLFSGCKGNPLPSGMEESTLLKAGRDVALLLIDGDYEAVYGLLRSDVAEGTSADAIGQLVQRQLEGAGTYKQIDSSMVTGQSSSGERYGVAVLYCGFTKRNVLFRLAFDPGMSLIGLEIKPQ